MKTNKPHRHKFLFQDINGCSILNTTIICRENWYNYYLIIGPFTI